MTREFRKADARPAMLTLSRPFIDETCREAASDVLDSGWIGYGPKSHDLEAAFTRGHTRWSLATHNCTAALWIAARMLRTSEDDEVIMPATTFAACLGAFSLAGWTVRLCDVDPLTGLADLEDAESRITDRTRALVVVDLFGQLAPMGEARRLCDARGLRLIRDAAHRLDLERADGPPADLTCYSLGPTKEIATPDGGMLCSTVPELEAPARALAWWGATSDTWDRTKRPRHRDTYFSAPFGLKLKMNDVSAAIALGQMGGLGGYRAKRRELYRAYVEGLSGSPLVLPERREDDALVYAYGLVPDGQRDRLRERLQADGVATSTHYPSLTEFIESDRDRCARAERFGDEVMTLPLHLGLSIEGVRYVCARIRDFHAAG